jgi:hypothetical protein
MRPPCIALLLFVLPAVGCDTPAIELGETSREKRMTCEKPQDDLGEFAGTYVSDDNRGRDFDSVADLPGKPGVAPPAGDGIAMLTIGSSGTLSILAWIKPATGPLRQASYAGHVSLEKGLFKMRSGGFPGDQGVGRFELVAQPQVSADGLTLTTRDDRFYDKQLFAGGRTFRLHRTRSLQLCARKQDCDAGERCSAGKRAFGPGICARRADLFRDEYVGSYALSEYARRPLDRVMDAMPDERRDPAPAELIGMLTLRPDMTYSAQTWEPTVADPKRRVVRWKTGLYDVTEIDGKDVLILNVETGESRVDTDEDLAFATLFYEIEHAGQGIALVGRRGPTSTRRGTYYDTTGQHIVLERARKTALCETSKDCLPFFGDPRNWICEFGEIGLSWCMDVHHVPRQAPPEVPAALDGVVGSYTNPTVIPGGSPAVARAVLNEGRRFGQNPLDTLTLDANGKYLVSGFIGRDYTRGAYTVEHVPGQADVLLHLVEAPDPFLARFRKRSRPDPRYTLRFALVDDDHVRVTMVAGGRKSELGRSFVLDRNRRTALCQAVNDCSVLAITGPKGRWACEAFGHGATQSFCIDAPSDDSIVRRRSCEPNETLTRFQ